MATLFHGALKHRGIALVNDRQAKPALESGGLVHVLPDAVGRVERISVVYPDRTFLDPKVRAFVELAKIRASSRTAAVPLVLSFAPGES